MSATGAARRPATRISELDALRGLAALYVLVHHNLVAAGLLESGFARWLEATPLQGLLGGRPPVLFFFVLSGYVLSRALGGTEGVAATARGYVAWVLQRSVRLGLPALAALTVSLLFYQLTYDLPWPGQSDWLRRGAWSEVPTAEGVIQQALLLSGRVFDLDNVLWSLQHEWRLSLLLPVLVFASAFQGGRGASVLLMAALAVAAITAGPYGQTFYLGVGPVRSLRVTLYFLLPFALGVTLDKAGVDRIPANRWQTVAGLAAIAGLARVGSDLAVYGASAILIWLSQQPGLLRRGLLQPALTWLGTISFSLYLVHVPVLAALHHGLHAVLPTTGIASLSLVAALPAAWLFWLVVEHPAHRLARGMQRVFATWTLARA